MTFIKTTAALLISSSLQSNVALAHDDHEHHNERSCNISLNYDLSIKPDSMVVSDSGTEKYRVVNEQLFVDGKRVELNKDQSSLLNQYTHEMYSQVPEVIEIVNDAMNIASGAISITMNSLLGDNADHKIDELMTNLEKKVQKVAYQDGNEFYLGATESTIDAAFDEEFEEEIENAVKNSLGSIMISLGGQLLSSEGGSFDEKMTAFEQKMETMGKQIETQVEAKAQVLEHKADAMCEDFKALAQLEKEVRIAIPELADFPVAVTEKNTSI